MTRSEFEQGYAEPSRSLEKLQDSFGNKWVPSKWYEDLAPE